VTPEQLRKEADETEALAQVVSYARDKAWLTAKAEELRRRAEIIEKRSWSQL
jgi:hypothetical protein